MQQLRRLCAAALVCLALSSWSAAKTPPETTKSAYAASRAAAGRCGAKLKALEDFAAQKKPKQKHTTQFSQDEINSYLALELSAKYHPSLKSLVITLEENKIQATGTIDFDRLGSSSTKLLPKIINLLFSGIRTLTADGQLIAASYKAHFVLHQARFDGATLPKYLVEQIITAVGRKQNPPFDPLKPSELFYEIEKAEVHKGCVIVYQ